MISDEDIEKAKFRADYNLESPHHEHNDCVRIAYEWLDAQKKTKTVPQRGHASKSLIERWAGRYVSQSDVSVAAELHPDIRGTFPHFNISARLIEPSLSRLSNIGEAFKHENYRESHKSKDYSIHE